MMNAGYDRQNLLAQGHAALHAGNVTAARSQFAAIRAMQPDNPDALHGLACVALAAGGRILPSALRAGRCRLPHGVRFMKCWPVPCWRRGIRRPHVPQSGWPASASPVMCPRIWPVPR
ncbi:hypothetical protein RAA17_08010 [Komagataeibacter rhaeticus]|nr:hypothetical protein [Komagataeibacter rhaeticus]